MANYWHFTVQHFGKESVFTLEKSTQQFIMAVCVWMDNALIKRYTSRRFWPRTQKNSHQSLLRACTTALSVLLILRACGTEHAQSISNFSGRSSCRYWMCCWCCELQGPLEAVQFRRRNWHFPAFPAPASLCFCLSVSVSVSQGKSRPFADTSLSLAHTHTDTYSFCISLLFFTFLHPSWCLSSLCLRGIPGQRSHCHIGSHPVWQNDEHHTGSGLLDRTTDCQPQHTRTHMQTHTQSHTEKQTCWLYLLFYQQPALKASLLYNK